ncbi:hypothetical protein L598_006600000020 [Mesorhizobium sp. J18]|uniref:hypothetical protein n=1 Tax=Mesorhizobium sp. J18 TaxID=935263 RepID=UPI00119A7045|nr:hypothetical protein [Mesorhizobium sp. J18]TWG90657.1 hypothetical protein L598_006600000020 [Mesorhizobium sp. J18]
MNRDGGHRRMLGHRPPGSAPQSPSPPRPDTPAAEHRHVAEATTTLLFYYSMLTFGGHRIHYHRDYARDVEGYPGPVAGLIFATVTKLIAKKDLCYEQK